MATVSKNEAADVQPIDPNDILSVRIAATKEWLGKASPETLSIQLLGTNDPSLLRLHLKELGNLIEMNKIFVYRTLAKQKPFLTVLYGSFNSYRAAQEALDKLPESLKGNDPFLRTIKGIREEIARLEAS